MSSPTREIPIQEMFGDAVEEARLTGAPGETWLMFRSGRWMVINFNTGTLKAFAAR